MGEAKNCQWRCTDMRSFICYTIVLNCCFYVLISEKSRHMKECTYRGKRGHWNHLCRPQTETVGRLSPVADRSVHINDVELSMLICRPTDQSIVLLLLCAFLLMLVELYKHRNALLFLFVTNFYGATLCRMMAMNYL